MSKTRLLIESFALMSFFLATGCIEYKHTTTETPAPATLEVNPPASTSSTTTTTTTDGPEVTHERSTTIITLPNH